MKVHFNYLLLNSKIIIKLSLSGKLIKSSDYTLGKYVNSVEKKFTKYFGSKYAIAVNSGTDALILALEVTWYKKWR